MWIGQTGLTSSSLQNWCLTSSNAKITHRLRHYYWTYVLFWRWIIHGCLLKCEYCRFKIYHFALFTLSLWYFIFFLLNSYILLVYFLVHSTIFIYLLLHFYLGTALHVILFMVKSLMNSVNSLLHLIYVHCFPFVIFQRSKLSHVFHRKVPMIWCVLIWNS